MIYNDYSDYASLSDPSNIYFRDRLSETTKDLMNTTLSQNKPSRLKTWFQSQKSKLGGTGNPIGWNKMSGLNIGSHNIGKMSNIGLGIGQGISAFQGMSNNSGLESNKDDLVNDILRSAMSNPMANSYLTSEQETLLNNLKNGRDWGDSSGLDGFGSGIANSLGSAAMSALSGGALGGIPGAIIGGIGGLISGGLEGMGKAKERDLATLEALYSTLYNAEQQYRTMKRPNINGLDLRSPYREMWM